MTEPLLSHRAQLLELVSHQIVAHLLTTRLRLFVGDGGDSEEEGFIRDIVELVVNSSTEEDSLVTDEGDVHEVVGRV